MLSLLLSVVMVMFVGVRHGENWYHRLDGRVTLDWFEYGGGRTQFFFHSLDNLHLNLQHLSLHPFVSM